MTELKVYCDCGQKFKFDVEPVNGQMPFAVACPYCKRDGTAKANEMLQQMRVFHAVEPATAAAPAPAAPAAPPTLRIGATSPAVHASAPISIAAASPTAAARPSARTTSVPQQDRAQVEAEARAKILWGDRPDEVIHFLMLRGFTNDEASEEVHAMIRERSRTIRAKGVVKASGGTLLTLGSTGALVTFLKIGFFSPFVLGGIGLAIVCGLWLFLNGLWKIIAPGAQSGDASDND